MDLVLYASWLNGMTRVADSFLLNPEQESVSMPPASKNPPAAAPGKSKG